MKHESNTDTEKILNRRERRGLWPEVEGTLLRPKAMEGRGGKRRPTPKAFGAGLAWNQFRQMGLTAVCGWRVGKFTGSCHLATASCRLMREFYRIATACCRLIWIFYRVLPGKSTQVVDFPHLVVASIFCEDMKWWQKRGNKLTGTGIITGTWADATKEYA
jgi:hypothetical protein